MALAVLMCTGCGEEQSAERPRNGFTDSSQAQLPRPATEGFILRPGAGEVLQNGIVVKASPATGTEGSILVEQTFPRGRTTNLHLHEQGDELFYVVSGRGAATLGDREEEIGPGDVIFIPRFAVHRIANLTHDEPLRVVFFMDSPQLVEEFRAIHERITSDPTRPITPEERAAISKRIGGGRAVER
jgi:mannose-6-phosphate isomerase-like protein (cupin superfamily)